MIWGHISPANSSPLLLIKYSPKTSPSNSTLAWWAAVSWMFSASTKSPSFSNLQVHFPLWALWTPFILMLQLVLEPVKWMLLPCCPALRHIFWVGERGPQVRWLGSSQLQVWNCWSDWQNREATSPWWTTTGGECRATTRQWTGQRFRRANMARYLLLIFLVSLPCQCQYCSAFTHETTVTSAEPYL